MIQEQILEAEIAKLDQQIHELGMSRANKRYELANLLCPFRVGDILVRKGQRAQVTAISPGYFSGYKMEGAYYKKDGNLGIRTGELWRDDWRKA